MMKGLPRHHGPVLRRGASHVSALLYSSGLDCWRRVESVVTVWAALERQSPNSEPVDRVVGMKRVMTWLMSTYVQRDNVMPPDVNCVGG